MKRKLIKTALPIMKKPLFGITFTSGLIFTSIGYLLKKFPPGSRNILYGYRTPRSMETPERWRFAQKYSAREMIKSGGLLLLLSFILLGVKANTRTAIRRGTLLSILFALIPIYRTEKKLIDKFEEEEEEEEVQE